MREAVRSMWKAALAVFGGAVTLAGLVLDGIGVVQLGPPFWVWQATGAAIFFVATGLLVHHHRRAREEPEIPEPKDTPDQSVVVWPVPHPRQRDFRNVELRVATLFHSQSFREGMLFDRCTLVGPGMIYLDERCKVDDCTLVASSGEDVEKFLLRIPDDHSGLTGPMLFEQSTFRECTFVALGFIGRSRFIDSIHDSLKTAIHRVAPDDGEWRSFRQHDPNHPGPRGDEGDGT